MVMKLIFMKVGLLADGGKFVIRQCHYAVKDASTKNVHDLSALLIQITGVHKTDVIIWTDIIKYMKDDNDLIN